MQPGVSSINAGKVSCWGVGGGRGEKTQVNASLTDKAKGSKTLESNANEHASALLLTWTCPADEMQEPLWVPLRCDAGAQGIARKMSWVDDIPYRRGFTLSFERQSASHDTHTDCWSFWPCLFCLS